LHDEDGWQGIRETFDLTVFTNADVENCLERLKVRNQCIPGYTPEEIAERVERVDRANADLVMETMSKADMVVESAVYVPEQTSATKSHRREPSHLNLITMQDIDKIEPSTIDTTDWTMDIGSSRPRSDSMGNDNSLFSSHAGDASAVLIDDGPAPPPAASFLGTWEPETAKTILQKVQGMDNPKRPFMVALVGIPGGGKSVSSFMLANFLEESKVPTMVCPHDGYHFPLDYLRTWPNADDAIVS